MIMTINVLGIVLKIIKKKINENVIKFFGEKWYKKFI